MLLLFLFIIFLENPEKSIPDAANFATKSWGTVHNTLKKHRYHPYKYLPVQNLNDDQKIRRYQFCQEMIMHIQNDGNFLKKIIFTDEATFTTAGMFNRKNKRYWATENPHKIQPVKIQGRRAVHVWCGMLANKVIGPIIFEGNLTGARYMHFLQHEIENLLEDIPIQRYNNLIWQQDGAPPHNVGLVTHYLNEKYNFWIGRQGTLRWPPNSPDLNPLDIFLWGYLKNKIYYERPQNINVLRQQIENEIFSLNRNNSDFIANAINRKLRKNIFNCRNNGGGYVENL